MIRSVLCEFAPSGVTAIMVAFEDEPCLYCGERAGDHREADAQ